MLPRLLQRWGVFLFFPLAAASCTKSGDVAAPSDGSDHTATRSTGANTWHPMDSGTTELLWGVSGSLEHEVAAVGTRGTAIHLGTDVWQGKATGTFRDLCDVWGSADGHAIAVGTFGTAIGYDGVEWSPQVSGTQRNLYDVWGFEESWVVAVGDSGVILKFDDTGWTPMTSGTSVSLFGAWGDAPTDLFAVGVGGTILKFDGVQWSFMDTPTPQNLSAVWGTSGTNVWAVGDGGMIIHFDGTSWTSLAPVTGANLYDVWGSAANDVWVVGKNGTILHYDGSTFASVDSGTDRDLFGVWGRSADEAYAVGADGTVLRWGGEVDANTTIWLCHDHPDGAVAPPIYGLRIDDLLGPGHYTFSFDYADGVKSARVTLTCDQELGQVHIAGRAFGGRVVGDGWDPSSRGWVDIDFTYTTNLAVKDDCGAVAGDDYYITGENPTNEGTVALDGWGQNRVFSFFDRSGEDNGCSFTFDNDYDSKGNAQIADDLSIWSATGWIAPAVDGSRDWLFIAEKITAPLP